MVLNKVFMPVLLATVTLVATSANADEKSESCIRAGCIDFKEAYYVNYTDTIVMPFHDNGTSNPKIEYMTFSCETKKLMAFGSDGLITTTLIGKGDISGIREMCKLAREKKLKSGPATPDM